MKQTRKRLELRKSARYTVYLTVSVLKDDYTQEHLLGEGDAFDLSAKGCQIVSEIGLAKGGYVGLRLFLPSQELPVRIDLAAVRWVQGQKSGLEFITMASKDRKRLDQFVRTLQRVAGLIETT